MKIINQHDMFGILQTHMLVLKTMANFNSGWCHCTSIKSKS